MWRNFVFLQNSLFSWEVFTVISRKILFFWEKCHFEKNPIFIRKRQDFLMIITACSQCQPVEKFWLDAALGKMWRNFVFLQNSLFSWEILFFSKILCFCFCYTLYVYFSYTLYVYFCYTLYVCFCYTLYVRNSKSLKLEKFEVGKDRSWKKSTLQKFEVGNVQRIKWRW